MEVKKFSLPDPKKSWGKIIILALVAALGLAFYYYILPFLLTIVWGTTQLIIGLVAAGFLLAVVTNKKFWMALQILAEGIASGMLGWAIEMNPFNVLQMQIDAAIKDREELNIQSKKLKGQQAELTIQLQDRDQAMRLASREIDILKKKLQASPNDEDLNGQLETSSTKFANSKTFIDAVKPILNSIDKLVEFADKAYKKSGIALQNAKDTVEAQRATYNAVTVGSNAMNKAMKAFTGHPELNAAGEKALAALRTDVANKIGSIKEAIQISSNIMSQQDLQDAAKVSLAAESAQQFDLDQKFVYSSTVNKTQVGVGDNIPVQQGNKYLGILNSKKDNI